MSKAVLLIDMPESCSKCSAYESGGYNERLEPYDGACFLEKRCMNGHKVTKGRPDWCPLKPLPEKDNNSYYPDEHEDGYVHGYNTCIDEILKGAADEQKRDNGISQ